MRNFLLTYLDKLNFEQDCKEVCLNVFDVVGEKRFDEILSFYQNSENLDYEKMCELISSYSEELNVNYFSIWLVVLILMFKQLSIDYKNNNIPDEIFNDSILDIKYKAKECKLVKGVWGVFVSAWEMLFYKLKLFGFGALQFEITTANVEYKKNGLNVEKEDKVIAVHIPRREKHLLPTEVQESFEKGRKFFEPILKNPVFMCDSWLLYPLNKTLLSKDSNLYKFIDLFEIIFDYGSENYSEMWRLFDTEIDENNLGLLPEDSSFRRKYKVHMLNGGKIGHAKGVLKTW